MPKVINLTHRCHECGCLIDEPNKFVEEYGHFWHSYCLAEFSERVGEIEDLLDLNLETIRS